MMLDAKTYLQHLRAYIHKDYVVDDGSNDRVVLVETYFRPEDVKPQKRSITLLLSGPGMAFKLDQDDFETTKKASKPRLFHFLDDMSKPWAKRCDFVVFRVEGKRFYADCIEFKSKSLTADKIVPQLRAGVSWCRSLKHTVENYTGDKRKVRIRKFVFADNENPETYLDANRQLLADPSIRYYNFKEVNGLRLDQLENASFTEI
jgi:hypothetical protein